MHHIVFKMILDFTVQGNLVWPPLPQVVFGSLSLLAGLMALLLPETGRIQLPDTLEEADALAR